LRKSVLRGTENKRKGVEKPMDDLKAKGKERGDGGSPKKKGGAKYRKLQSSGSHREKFDSSPTYKKKTNPAKGGGGKELNKAQRK